MLQHMRDQTQDSQSEQSTEHRRGFTPHASGDADGGRHPQTRRSRQTLDLRRAAHALFQNGACTEKADACHQPLYDPTERIFIRAGHAGNQHEQRRAHAHKHMRADSGGLAPVLALIAQNSAQNSGHQQPDGDPGHL